MWILFALFSLSSFAQSSCPAGYKPYSSNLRDYRAIGRPCRIQGRAVTAIRSFAQGSTRKLLVVDELTLQTEIVREDACPTENRPRGWTSPYFQALDKYSKPADSRQYPLGRTYTEANQGFTGFSTKAAGCGGKVVLTTDLCPTEKGAFQKAFYERLIASGQRTQAAPTVVVPVSGLWLETHAQEFEWLKAQKGLKIIWANHSETHGLFPAQGRGENYPVSFLPGAACGGFWGEISAVEMRLIDLGVTPSIFMRYPGLVSSGEQERDLRKFGLISLGTNAWPALQGDSTNDYSRIFNVAEPSQRTRAGSVILGHGNKHLDSHLIERELDKNSQLQTISATEGVLCDLGIDRNQEPRSSGPAISAHQDNSGFIVY